MGTFGVLGCFSFHPSKNLAAAGDGGVVATDRADLQDRLMALRALGQVGQNNHLHVGYNTKLDSIQAKVLSWKLPFLDHWNEQRRNLACLYRERLSDLPLKFQTWDEGEEHVFHLFVIRTEQRDRLLEYLQSKGVRCCGSLPGADPSTTCVLQLRMARRTVPSGGGSSARTSVPSDPSESDDHQVEYVSDCVRLLQRQCDQPRLFEIPNAERIVMRVAIVGCGRMGRERTRAASAFRVEAILLFDEDRSRAESLASESARALPVADLDNLIQGKPDAIFILYTAILPGMAGEPRHRPGSDSSWRSRSAYRQIKSVRCSTIFANMKS